MMKFKNRLLILISVAAASLIFLNGCNNNNQDGEYIDVGGHPALVTMKKMDSLQLPDDFYDSIVYTDENYEQKQKFVLGAPVGEDIKIVNPSPEVLTKEDIERDIKVRDAYYVEDPSPTRSILSGEDSPYKKYTLVDADSKRSIKQVAPNGRAILRLNEPTKGGDLTIYEKEEGSPINFEGKDPSINQLIVSTTRDEVENFNANDEEMVGLLLSKCVDLGDLNHSIEGTFIYSEHVNLNRGDQFYIGESEEFDSDSTFYTFLDQEICTGGYRISYTAPDYALCYDKLDIHHEETPIDFDSYDEPIKMPTAEELIRSIDENGNINDLISDEVEKELQNNEVLGKKIFGSRYDPSITINLKIDSFVVSVTIGFNFGGPAFCMNFAISFVSLISSKSYGSWLLSGGVSLFFRKTFSTYCDFGIKILPYPRITYCMAVKTVSEISVNLYVGISFGMKPADAPVDKAGEIQQLQNDINEAVANVPPQQGDPSGDAPPSVSSESVSNLDPNANVVPMEGENIEPILSYNNLDKHIKPNRAIGDDNQDYGDDALGKHRYQGLGLIISGPGLPITLGPVTLEIGVSLVINPNIQGRFFVTYNHVSCEIVAKVVKGFETPEGYGEEVEYSRSRWVIGLYVKLGFEVGVMLEVILYITGSKKAFYAAIQFTFGVYFAIQGVGCVMFGSSMDTTFMVYASIQAGFFFRISIVLNILDDKWIINIKAFEYKWPPFFAFGTNLHFLQFIDQRDEFDWFGGHYININEMNVLELTYFSTDSFTVGDGHYDWNYRAYYSSVFGTNTKRLFDDLKILEGEEYISFDFNHGWFEVKDDAVEIFDFKFKISIDKWLGCTCDDKTYTVHYFSNKLRAIKFNGFPNAYEKGGVHIGGGLIKQGEIYEAPVMPDKEDGTPFYGWLGNNGLFLEPGERMEVGSMSITFQPVYRPQVTYLVQFYDGYDNLISAQKVAPGGSAEAPNPETRDAKMDGATFICWDRAFDEVYSNFNVYGIYAIGGKQ